MHKLLLTFCRHPWLVLGVIFVVSMLASLQLDNVKVQISADDLLVQDDPERLFFRQVTEEFGDESVILLYLSDEQLLGKDKLTQLKASITQIEALNFVDRVESLFSVPYLKTIDGYLNKDPYLQSIPDTPDDAAGLLSSASLNPFIKKTLLSEDHKVMAVAIVLVADISVYSDAEITRSLAEITEQLETHYHEVFTVGFQHVRNEVANEIRKEQGKLLPFAIGALLVALFLLLRQLVDIIIPIITAAISILWTLGLMGLIGIPLNIVTSMVPILLIIVGSTEDIHLLAEFRRGQHNGMDNFNAIRQMAKKMGSVVALTFVTTFLGFLSVSISKIEVLWQFGILSSAALFLNFLVTISLIPAILRLAGEWQLDGKSRLFQSPEVEPARARSFFIILRKYRWYISAAVLVISIVAINGIFSIKVNHNPIDSLSQYSEVRKQFEKVNANLAGLESMSIVIDSGIQDTFLKIRYLEEANEIQQFINQQPGVQSTTSFLDYLSLLNAAFEEEAEPILPDSDEIVNELMIFLKYEHVQAYVSDDYSKLRILIRHNISSTLQLDKTISSINGFIEEKLDEGLTAKLTGDSVLTLSATNAMIEGQLKSIALLLVIIIVIISMLFLDWKVGVIASLPNIFPVVVLFGVMGYADIPLNIGTTMAAAIAIGIAVDDTMHFMLRYNNVLKSKRSKYAAMYETIHNEALPVFATSLALISGFLVFSLSEFEPVAQFGFLSALVILAALIADFVITPLAISAVRLVSLWDMMSLSLRKEVVEKSDLFKGLKTWQIRKFILSSSIEYYRKGEVVFRENDDSETMYMVMRGQIQVTHHTTLRTTVIKELFGPGDVFGDVSMFANIKRSTEAVALEQASLLVLSRDGIRNSTNYHPVISSRLFFNIATHVSKRFSALLHEEKSENENIKDRKDYDETV
jgi:predicted RND superfamily exporter protein/CRP-like cAMP-binding protein